MNMEYLIYGPDLSWALSTYSYIKNGSNDLIILIDEDKRKHDICKLLLLIAQIMVIYQHSSFALHIVLPVIFNNGSPKGSLGPFYSNLGYGLLTNKVKDMMKSINILFNQIYCDKHSY